MSDLDDSSPPPSPARSKPEQALHNGPAPRLAMWSTQDPVTMLEALRCASGWDQVSRLVGWLGSGWTTAGGPSTVTPTLPRSISPLLPTHRRSKRQGGRRCFPSSRSPIMLGSAGATSGPRPSRKRIHAEPPPGPAMAASGPRPCLVPDLLPLVRLSLCSCRLVDGGPIVITPEPVPAGGNLRSWVR